MRTRRLPLLIAAVLLLTVVVRVRAQTASRELSRDSIAKMLSAIVYAVPESPAFELLPGKASDIGNITTPADLTGQVTEWVDGAHLRSGAALDYRIFGATVGSLRQYRRSAWRRLLWRTVLAAGTASPAKGSRDMLIAAGVRIPLIDRGDPRLDTSYQHDMSLATQAVERSPSCRPASLTQPTTAISAKCSKALADSVKAIEARFMQSGWNAFRLEVGVAGSLRAASATMDWDSLSMNQGGVWLGLSRGLGPKAQLNLMAKLLETSTDSASQERTRYVVGARLRAFPGRAVGISAEAAWVNSKHGTASLDGSWTHLAVVLELPLSRLGSVFKGHWLALAYGGDAGRKGGHGNRISVGYSIYRNKILKQGP